MARKPNQPSRRASRGGGLSLAETNRQFAELNQIGVALSEIRDVEQLLGLILTHARQITRADAGSLYLVEDVAEGSRAESTQTARSLRFRLAQNDSVEFSYRNHTLPISEESLAGYCALHGRVIELADAYRIASKAPFSFNPSMDEQSGYRTRSLLTVPMKNGKGEVLGVLQLINCKRSAHQRLSDGNAVRRHVHPFPRRAVESASSLASQAAVAYENSRLYRDIENLFDGFVHAAVTAIEQRDPSTSGHSQRVCAMTVALAQAMDRQTTGPYTNLRLSREQLKELRYAALLHDFGKVGVREDVLVKAKKLQPLHFLRVMDRFDYIRRDIEARTAQQKVEILLTLSAKAAGPRIRALDEEAGRQLAKLDEYAEFVSRANEPTVLPASDFGLLHEIASRTFCDGSGRHRTYLTDEEVRFLSIARGSLDGEERRQIESHVTHTFNFLLQIPWTSQLREIPRIARAHHEKLNGTGYPGGLSSSEIPVQAKMMTVCDIYDALVASDRPYKRAIPHERALDILAHSVRDGEIDGEMFRVFLESKVHLLVAKSA